MGNNAEPYLKPGPDWVRDAVKGLMHRNAGLLKERGVDTSLFHNHNETNSQNKPTYPLIIYHFADAKFMVTGINEGAYALEQLMALYNFPVEAGNDLLVTFRKLHGKQTIEVVPTPQANTYRLCYYLPFNPKVHKEYDILDAGQKMELLRQTITKHLVNDMFKYLQIPVFDPRVQVLDIVKLDQKRHTYKEHHYLSFDLVFAANASLPVLLTLGNGKAFGYGTIQKYAKLAER